MNRHKGRQGPEEQPVAVREILKANTLWVRHGHALLRDEHLGELFENYRTAISSTQEQMQKGGIVEACSICAGKEAGSCCFEGVEAWYDHVLLLINRIMGIQLPDSRETPGGCLFVSHKGCKLLARHAFCVNFLCPALKTALKPPQTEKLHSAAGKELLCGWDLEKSIRNWLRQHRTSGILNDA